MSQEKIARMEYFISLLDDYLDGKLDRGRTSVIQKALQEDPFLNEVLKQHVQARSNIRIAGEDEIKNKFAKSFDAIPEEPKEKPKLIKLILWLSILLTVAAAAYFYFCMQ